MDHHGLGKEHQDFVNHKPGRSGRLAAFFDSVSSRSIMRQPTADDLRRLIDNVVAAAGLNLTFQAQIASPNQIGGAHRRARPWDSRPADPTFRGTRPA